MRIALDIRYRTRSGSSSMIQNLVPRMLERNTGHEFVFVRFPDQALDGVEFQESIVCPGGGSLGQIIWDQCVLPRRLKAAGADLYHSMKMLGPFYSHCPQLRVAHSIINAYRGEFPHTRRASLYWSTLGNSLYRHSTRIIAVSGFVRDYLMEVLSIPESRINVIYNGLDTIFKPREAGTPTFQGDVGIRSPYLLIVGNLFPVKNQVTAVLAFQRIAKELPDHTLVMAGGTEHPYSSKVMKAVNEAGLRERVRILGYVENEKLVALYNQADILLMPSLTEGCPVSLLEAMGCGVPVIASGRGGIPEIGGGAVSIVEDPFDVSGWSDAILSLIHHPDLREKMRRAGLQRAGLFTWDETAKRTLDLYGRMQEESSVSRLAKQPIIN